MTDRYQPSNGAEGMAFMGQWCATCARDKVWNGEKDLDECEDGDLCRIIGDTFAYDQDEPEYPKEWRYDERGRPVCIAWVSVGEPIPIRCPNTRDMFE